MNTLKTKNNIDSIVLAIFLTVNIISLPVILILTLAALFFGLPWAWVGGGLITFVVLSIGTLVTTAFAAFRRL